MGQGQTVCLDPRPISLLIDWVTRQATEWAAMRPLFRGEISACEYSAARPTRARQGGSPQTAAHFPRTQNPEWALSCA